jgi:hypothetical protein
MRTLAIRSAVLFASITLLAAPALGQGHGPTITIRANGNEFVKAILVDNQPVSLENLGDYLTRVGFKSTEKTPIKADDANPDRATLKGKFDLDMVNRRETKTTPVMSCTFTEIRLARSKSNPGQWFLTAEGIGIIEEAAAEKKK